MRLRTKPVPVGKPAPDFTLPDQDGNPVSLHELLGEGPVVVFFYPRAFSAVCTSEVCSFRDNFEEFAAAGARVVGISGDSVERQKSFHDRYHVSFPLLSDAQAEVHALYGIRSSARNQLLNDRITFVIDSEGIVRHHSTGLVVSDPHVRESLETVKSLA